MATKLKKWYHSKTILLNGIAGIIGLLPEMLSVIDVNLLTLLGVTDPMKYYTLIGTIATILNIYLRAQGSTPSAPIQTKSRKKIAKDEKDN